MKRKLLITAALFTFLGNTKAQELIKVIENAHPGGVTSVAITGDGSNILSGGADKRASLWDTKSGDKLKSFGHTEKVNVVTYSSNNKLFATGSLDNKLIILDKDGKPKQILREHAGEITSAAFNPLNDYLASGSKDNTIKIWDIKTNKSLLTFRGHTKSVNAVAVNPDGTFLASGSSDNTIKIWDINSGELKNTINSDSKEVVALSYSSDGKYLLSGGINGSVTLWEASTGNLIGQLPESKSSVTAVCFTPDVQYAAASFENGKVLIWNVEQKKLIKKVEAGDKKISSIVFSDKGGLMISACMDGNIKVWDASGLNIGPKKFLKDNAQPKLVCTGIILKDDNGNGIIDRGEKPSLNFTIRNQGEGRAYNVTAKVELSGAANGLKYDKEILIGNLEKGKGQNVIIPIITTDEIESAGGTFTVSVIEANSNNPSPMKFAFQTKGDINYSYIMVTDYAFSSATGKAEIGAPITLKMKLKNKSSAEAKNIKVNYNLPKSILAVDKLSEAIPSFQPGEEKEINVQFYADKSFTETEFKIGVDIEGGFSNVKDLKLNIKLNEKLPETVALSDVQLAQSTPANDPEIAPSAQPTYRGSADPLKGLNIAKAKSMQIGDYYALLIGIDKYQGEWPPLKNAVNDAKAVETTLKTKYKFDHFKSLYDEEANRENIIKAMEWLVANVKEKDNVLIFYSGHGEYKQSLNKGYWVPVDARTTSVSNNISNSDIQTFLGGIKSKHTLLVSDACFSGDIFRGNTVSVPFEDSEKYYTEVHNLTSRQAITSGGVEPVLDGGSNGHSVFTHYFLNALNANGNKYLDAGQLYNTIKIPVINNSEQSPKLSPIKNTGDEGGQFIFIKK